MYSNGARKNPCAVFFLRGVVHCGVGVLPPARRGIVRCGVGVLPLSRRKVMCGGSGRFWEILRGFGKFWESFFAALKPRRNIKPYCLQ